jgi:hypothetical protein
MLSQLKSEDASPPVGSLKCNTVLPTKRWFWDTETKIHIDINTDKNLKDTRLLWMFRGGFGAGESFGGSDKYPCLDMAGRTQHSSSLATGCRDQTRDQKR